MRLCVLYLVCSLLARWLSDGGVRLRSSACLQVPASACGLRADSSGLRADGRPTAGNDMSAIRVLPVGNAFRCFRHRRQGRTIPEVMQCFGPQVRIRSEPDVVSRQTPVRAGQRDFKPAGR